MTPNGWLQIGLFFVVILAVTKPLGVYMFRVFEGERQPLPRVLGPVERLLFRLTGVNPKREQSWVEYTVALLVFSALGVLVTFSALVRGLLPGDGRIFAAETLGASALYAARLGFEIMATGAACRTYNVLVAEGRAVAAALMIE